MPNSTVGQEWIFLGCLVAGLIIGLVYEACFILRFCFSALFKPSNASSETGAGTDKTGSNALTAGKMPHKPEKKLLFRRRKKAGNADAARHFEKEQPGHKGKAAGSNRLQPKESGRADYMRKYPALLTRLTGQDGLPSFLFTVVFDLIFFAACLAIVLISADLTAYGQFFWFSAAAYILGFTLERISLGIIVAKFIRMIYNTFARFLERLKKIKFFAKLFR